MMPMKKSRYGVLLFSPLLTGGILLLVYSLYYLFPFDDRTVSWCDMSQQVVPLLCDFKDILTGKADMFLNLANAGGMSFWGVFFFFISSPMSFLVLLVDKADMMLLANVMVLLKLMFCAASAGFFFLRLFPRLHPAQNTAFSVMYALCGFNLILYQNVVWLDMAFWFPLLVLSLLRIIQKEKAGAYCLCLTAVLLTNYYLSYMVVVFVILAFTLYLFLCCDKPTARRSALLLAGATGISLALSAVVLVPSFVQYLESARGASILETMKNTSPFGELDTKLPFILCTGAALPGLIYLFFYRKGARRKVRFLLAAAGMMLLPILVEPVNLMWHTGSYQAFPVRYGYMVTLVVLIVCAFSLSRMNRVLGETRLWGALGGALAVGLVCASSEMLLSRYFDELTVYTRTLWGNSTSLFLASIAFCIFSMGYYLCILLYRFRGVSRRVFSLMLLAVTLLEGFFNARVYVGSAAVDDQRFRKAMALSEITDTDGFYRVKFDAKYFDVNDMGAAGLNTLNHYTSLTTKTFLAGTKKWGYSSYWMEVASNDGTMFGDSLLCNRYVVARNSMTAWAREGTAYQTANYLIYDNPYCMPLGVVAREQPDAVLDWKKMDRPALQNMICQQIFGGSTLFEKYQPNRLEYVELTHENSLYTLANTQEDLYGIVEYNIPVKGEQTLYFDAFRDISNSLEEPINESFLVRVDGVTVSNAYPAQMSNGILELGRFKDTTVNVTVQLRQPVQLYSFGVWGMNLDVLQEVSKIADQTPGLAVDGHTVSGQVTAEGSGEYLFVQIPYDKGFRATVNGKAVKVEQAYDAYMALPLEQGENVIKMTYIPRGFLQGVALSLLGLAAAVLLALLRKRRWMQKLREALELPAWRALQGLFILVALAVYAAPFGVFLLKLIFL